MSVNDQKTKQADQDQERCWFCRRAIYKAAEGSQGGGVVVEQELQEAYLSCQHPAVTNPFIQAKTANTNQGDTGVSVNAGPQRAHQSCRDQALLWIEIGSANPREAAEKLDLKNFWQLPPHQQAALRGSLKKK